MWTVRSRVLAAMCDIQGPKGPGPTGRIGQLKGVALETFQLSDLTPRGRSTRKAASNFDQRAFVK